jgi:hypothetical protein
MKKKFRILGSHSDCYESQDFQLPTRRFNPEDKALNVRIVHIKNIVVA